MCIRILRRYKTPQILLLHITHMCIRILRRYTIYTLQYAIGMLHTHMCIRILRRYTIYTLRYAIGMLRTTLLHHSIASIETNESEGKIG